MKAVREQLNKPLWIGISAFVGGLFIGLVVLGWWLWPVQWTDAGPGDLRPEYQEIYLRMAIDSYTNNQDAAVAQQRIAEVGENADELLAQISADPQTQSPESIQAFILFAGGEVAAVTPAAPETRSAARTLLPWLCAITLVLAGVLVLVFMVRNRSLRSFLPARKEAPSVTEYPEYIATGEEPPLSQFMTTYQIGNDLYDDSFSIDSPAGEFLGECGVGISETIGVGDPKKVTAFEVWLFDKNDIQTVTKVLMSEHAYTDGAISQRLRAKGELELAAPDKEFVLETQTLTMVARVVNMAYDEKSPLPPKSVFDNLLLELAVWQK